MFWLFKRFRKSTEPRKKRRKSLVAVLLIVALIAYQNLAPKDSDFRKKIEDLVASVTDLLP